MKIEIYTKPFCPYCSRAIAALKNLGLAFIEHGSKMNTNAVNAAQREQMIQRTGGPSSYPQIFFGGTYIGGSDDLMSKIQDGTIAKLLS